MAPYGHVFAEGLGCARVYRRFFLQRHPFWRPLELQAGVVCRGIWFHNVRVKFLARSSIGLFVCAGVWLGAAGKAFAVDDPLAWPEVTTQAKPHAYWWWMGSAVDTNNITKELTRYRDAGLGGVHIIPIYGAKGWESNYISYLSPKWMTMLDYTVTEAKRLGMEVDMTTGTGWCFGGPHVTDEEGNAVMVSDEWRVASGGKVTAKLNRVQTQALMAFGPDGKKVDLLGKIAADGSVNWTAPKGSWKVYAISQKPSGQKVKRAAPGGEGWMLNLAYPKAMTDYLRRFDAAFKNYHGAMPRAQYHDSYEYKLDWSPVLFAEFQKRRGYRLQDYLDVFLSGEPADLAARVKCDYRETISDLLLEDTEMWVKWSHDHGFITRNEAHGSPGNWLDLYAAADIPETEMFHLDRNKLISKFASSAAHVTGKPLVSAETGTWLTEHFTETLTDMKCLLDDLFLSGVNHVFYHGTCYSPDQVPWPGWVFYASYEMNPRNAIWHDVGALNAYATRCQSVLQAGQPDNDILLYWPIHDFWSNPDGMVRNLTVHARDWFEDQPIGKTAEKLWQAGYQFDYVSDRQLAQARVVDGRVKLPDGEYKAIVVPQCKAMPFATLSTLVNLAKGGAMIVFESGAPLSIAGLSIDPQQERLFSSLCRNIPAAPELRTKERTPGSFRMTEQQVGSGKVISGDGEGVLMNLGIAPEIMNSLYGLMCIRRLTPEGTAYFVANRSNKPFVGILPLARTARSIVVMNPMTGQISIGDGGKREGGSQVFLELAAGESVLLRCLAQDEVAGEKYRWNVPSGDPIQVSGKWRVKFLSGGPVLPTPFTTERLASWTELGDTNAASFAGTARYTLKFDVPGDRLKTGLPAWQLDFGKVCQSARVRLNGKDCGTLFTPPFRVTVDNLKTTDNVLEVEVTNTSANRIRDLDRRGVKWQNFHDINFVNLDYQKFDASNWPLADSGLVGPVTMTPVEDVNAAAGKVSP